MIGFGKPCQHPNVSRDPIAGGYFCVQCLTPFRRVPDAVLELSRTMNLWQRLRWALTTRTKVPVVPFEWTIAWAKSRDTEPRPAWNRKWGGAMFRPRKALTKEQLRKVYNHPSMREEALK